MHIVNYFDPRLGYAEFYLAKKQVEYGFNVCVVASDYSIYGNRKWLPGSREVEGINAFYLKSACKIRGNVWAFNPLALAKIIKFFSPNVIHCRGLLSPLAQEVLLLKRFYRYKVVADLISGISPLTFKLAPLFKTFFDSWISNKVDVFFACNKAIERFLLENLSITPSKIHLIPLGADQELFKPDNIKRERTRTHLGFPPEDVVAIYTGKFLPGKRIHDLLIASKPMIEQCKNFKVVLVGDGPSSYKRRLKILIKELEIKNNVFIVKTVHRTRLPNFYNAADFAVWPGSFSISIIEAMACGLPIIIAKSDWTSHYLEYKNGFSFRAGDLTTFTSLMFKLIQDNKLRKFMGDQSRRLVEDKLSWDVITRQYIEAYRACQVQNNKSHFPMTV